MTDLMKQKYFGWISLLSFTAASLFFTTTNANAEKKPTVLWDNWYVVTVDLPAQPAAGQPAQKLNYSYYNERVEIRESNRLFVQMKMWKKEDGFINQEHEGAFSTNDFNLTPLFFNLYRTQQSTETKIDGTVLTGSRLQIKIQKGGQTLPIVTKSLPKNTMFSIAFPVWIRRNLPELRKTRKSKKFQVVQEDGPDMKFNIIQGQVRYDQKDAFAEQTGTHRLIVNYENLPSVWWVKDDGYAARIVMPTQKAEVQLVPKDKAEKFLDNP